MADNTEILGSLDAASLTEQGLTEGERIRTSANPINPDTRWRNTLDGIAARNKDTNEIMSALVHTLSNDDVVIKENELKQEAGWIEASRILHRENTGSDFAGDDAAAAQYGIDEMGRFNYKWFSPDWIPWSDDDTKGVVGYLMDVDKFTDNGKLAFYLLMEAYHEKDMTWAGWGRAVKGIGSDPTSWFGLSALASISAKLAGRQLVGEGIRLSIKNAAESIMSRHGTKVAMTEGALFGGSDSVMRQQIKGDLANQELDIGDFLNIETGIGVAAGSLFGGAIVKAPAAGSFAYRKYADFIKEYMDPYAMNMGMVFHGTGNKWKGESHYPLGRPNKKHIDTGMGNQAMGYGLYFSESEIMAGRFQPHDYGVEDAILIKLQEAEDADDWMMQQIWTDLLDTRDGGRTIRQNVTDNPQLYGEAETAKINEALAYYDSLEKSAGMYTMDVPDADIDQMLNWNAPLADQPHILSTLNKLFEQSVGEMAVDMKWPTSWIQRALGPEKIKGMTGGELYAFIRDQFYGSGQTVNDLKKAQKLTSEFLEGAGIPGLTYQLTESYDDSLRNMVIWDQALLDRSKVVRSTFRNDLEPGTIEALIKRFPESEPLIPYLSAQEVQMLDRQGGRQLINNTLALVEQFDARGMASEMANVALAGSAKRGWYQESGRVLGHVFGDDFPRFAALLSATSPQLGVKENLTNALNIWKNWNAAGRPTDRDAIVNIMGDSVLGEKGVDSVLPAWINNSVTALTSTADDIMLSGGKVDSFVRNIMGDADAVTLDSWMARYFGIDQDKIGQTWKESWASNPGKNKNYMAMSVVTRKAAEILSESTGERWKPAEVQETVWSYVRVLVEMKRAGDTRSMEAIIRSGDLTDEAIRGADDFATLMGSDPDITPILEGTQYGERLEGLINTDRAAERFAGGTETQGSGRGTTATLDAEDAGRIGDRLSQGVTQ